MPDPARSPNKWPWPPIVFGLAILFGLGAHDLLATPLSLHNAGRSLKWIGALLIASGLTIDFAALLALRRHRTTVLPNRPAETLVTTGPFAFSRNPIYLGNTLLTAGIGLWLGTIWLVIAALAAALIVQHIAIRREEEHLAARFGTDWTAYTQRVRRWL